LNEEKEVTIKNLGIPPEKGWELCQVVTSSKDLTTQKRLTVRYCSDWLNFFWKDAEAKRK
jgi:hypothetical protein